MKKWKIGAIIGLIYSLGPWIGGGLTGSWAGVAPFMPSFGTFIALAELLKINQYLSLLLNITIWIGIGAGIGYLIDEYKSKK